MKPYRLIAGITFLLILSPAARAGIRPSFRLEACSWYATHVVVVTEGEMIDGKLDVLESWKGDLQPGQTISVPDLAAFRTKDSRLVRKPFWDRSGGPPEYVTGARMVFFLKEKFQAKNANGGAPWERVWEAASRQGMNVSVLWIEGEYTYAFIQVVNPGDSILVRYGNSESEIKNRFSDVNRTRESLNRNLEIKDTSARAEALEPFTSSELFLAQDAAFEGLRGCGKAALPVLRRMLNDQAKLKIHGSVITVMAEVGGEGVGEELTAVVREEMSFWQATAPGLKEGWWNAINEPETENLRARYSKVYDALLGLQKLNYVGSKQAVLELRDFWRSLPQLEDRSGLDQVGKACDEVLSKLHQ